jgi:hypothetical protein
VPSACVATRNGFGNYEGSAVAREAPAQLAIFQVSAVTGTTDSGFDR